MIWTGMTKYADFGILILRVGIGLLFIVYGFGKFQGGSQTLSAVGSAMGNFGVTGGHYVLGLLAALTEMIGGLLLVFGAFFRPATLLLAWIMLVAVVMHASKGDGLSGYSHPLAMLILFVALFFIGPGKYSVDGE